VGVGVVFLQLASQKGEMPFCEPKSHCSVPATMPSPHMAAKKKKHAWVRQILMDVHVLAVQVAP